MSECARPVVKIVFTLFALALFSGSAAAQTSKVTFNAPVQLPATILPAGTYTLQAPNQYSVHVLNAEGKRVAVIPASPVSRAASGGGIAILRDIAAGRPPRLAAWYPGDGRDGLELHYPKRNAVGQASATK